jgi:hypothetical protein
MDQEAGLREGVESTQLGASWWKAPGSVGRRFFSRRMLEAGPWLAQRCGDPQSSRAWVGDNGCPDVVGTGLGRTQVQLLGSIDRWLERILRGLFHLVLEGYQGPALADVLAGHDKLQESKGSV